MSKEEQRLKKLVDELQREGIKIKYKILSTDTNAELKLIKFHEAIKKFKLAPETKTISESFSRVYPLRLGCTHSLTTKCRICGKPIRLKGHGLLLCEGCKKLFRKGKLPSESKMCKMRQETEI